MKRYDRIDKTRMAAKAAKPPDPPGHLSKKMKDFWRGVFELDNPQPYHILLLTKACESFDRAEHARRILKKEGLTFEDRFGAPHARPEVAIERDHRALFAKLLGQCHLHNP